jgi:hypothetical protein
MDTLIQLLREIEANSALPDDYEATLYDDSVSEIQSLATELFISKEGTPLFDEMDRLQKMSGFYIYPGERDGFGWLSACLQTKKGVIVFG